MKVKLRHYSPEQLLFLKNMSNELVQALMTFPNPTEKRALAPLLVPKLGTTKYRFTVDLHSVNKCTIPHYHRIQRLETELPKLNGSKCYANFDLGRKNLQLE